MEAETLPFLVVHGGWFWIVLATACSALLFVLSVALFLLVRFLFARRKRRETLSWLRQHCAHELADGQTTLAGRWNRDAIDACGELIGLGDRWSVWPDRDVRIDVGAPVFVTGELRRTSLTNDGIVGVSTRWQFDRVMIYQDDPRVRFWRVGRVTAILFAATAVLVAYAGLRVLGGRLTDGAQHREYLPGDGGPLVLSNLDALSIAASLPGSRDEALDGLAWALRRHPYRDEASVERQRALARLQGGPCAAVGFLKPSGRYDEEIDLARRCGYRQEAFELELAKGDFTAAWADRPPRLDWPFGEGMLAVAIGNWNGAADGAERMAKTYDRSARERAAVVKELAIGRDGTAPAPDAQLAYALDEAHRFRCLSKWFRVLGGDPSAAAALRTLASDRAFHPVVCAPIVAQILIGEERTHSLIDALNAPDPDRAHFRGETLVRTLLWIDGENVRDLSSYPAWSNLISVDSNDPSAWLYGLGAERWRDKDPSNYIMALTGVALLDLDRGELVSARSIADEAVKVSDGADEGARLAARELTALVFARTGQTNPANDQEELFDVTRVRGGDAPRNEMAVFPESCEPQLTAARISAQAGDGRPLAVAMESCDVYWRTAAQTILGLLPLIKNGRPELATALRWWGDSDASLHPPFSSASRAALRRDLARLVGDRESAERWGRTAAALLEPLRDPTRRVALVLWDP